MKFKKLNEKLKSDFRINDLISELQNIYKEHGNIKVAIPQEPRKFNSEQFLDIHDIKTAYVEKTSKGYHWYGDADEDNDIGNEKVVTLF